MGKLEEPDIARVARMIGEPARAAMLSALLGGVALTAGELARVAGIAAPTASEHLAQLVKSRLILRRRSGRHVYYALAGRDVAAALEALARVSAPVSQPRAPKQPADAALRFARTCYDHLAGRLGVLVTQTMLDRGLIEEETFALTKEGSAWFASLDIDVAALPRRRRVTRPCLDWSERRDHLAGAAASALTAMMLERRWIARIDGTRAVRLTQRGREGLRRSLGLEVEVEYLTPESPRPLRLAHLL